MFFCLHLPDLCLLFILGHFFTVGEVELLDVLVPTSLNYFLCANIYMNELCLHACRYVWFIGCVFWCGCIWVRFCLRACVFLCVKV